MRTGCTKISWNADWLSLNHRNSTEGLCFEELNADWIEPESPGYCLVVWLPEQTDWAAGTRTKNPNWRILFWRAGCWLDRTGISWILIGVFWISAKTAGQLEPDSGSRTEGFVLKSWMLIGQNWNLLDSDWCILNFSTDCPGSWNQTQEPELENFVLKSWMLIGQNRNLLDSDWCILNFSTDCLASWNQTQESGLKDLFWRAGWLLDRTGISWILIGVFWISAQTAWAAGTKLRNQGWRIQQWRTGA